MPHNAQRSTFLTATYFRSVVKGGGAVMAGARVVPELPPTARTPMPAADLQFRRPQLRERPNREPVPPPRARFPATLREAALRHRRARSKLRRGSNLWPASREFRSPPDEART